MGHFGDDLADRIHRNVVNRFKTNARLAYVQLLAGIAKCLLSYDSYFESA